MEHLVQHMVAQRFLVAELLTKQWLMGVRRGWLSLLKPSIHDWSDVISAIGKLMAFTKGLESQILYARRGPYTVSPTMREGEELRKLIKTMKEAISDQRSRATHWMEVSQDSSPLNQGTFSKADGDKMFALYQDKFAELMTLYVKTYRTQHSYVTQREAQITEVLDKILVLLRADAQRLEKAIETEGEDSPTKQEYSDAAFQEFSYGRMKVIVVDPKAHGRLIKEYVKWVDKADQLLRAKGLGKLWYGVMFLKSMESEKLTEPEKASYAALGYVGLESRAGAYHTGADIFELAQPPSDYVASSIIHELGHRYWFKFMGGGQREHFESLVRVNKKPTDPEDIADTREILPVSTYGKSHIREAFAEAFTWYVLGRDMSSDQIESFRSVLASTENDSLARQVVSRFVHARHQ